MFKVWRYGREVVARIGAVTLACAPGLALAAGHGATVLGVRLGGDAASTRVVIDLSASTVPNIQTSGDRLIVEINATPGPSVSAGSGKGLVARWTSGGEADLDRLELAFSRPAHVAHRFAIPPGQGVAYWRYVVDLAPGADVAPEAVATESVRTKKRRDVLDVASAQPSLHADPEATPLPRRARGLLAVAQDNDASGAPEFAGDSPPPPKARHRATLASTAPARAPQGRKVVVIDAGHGGHDSGALGANHQEKELTLAAAVALKERLERTGRYKVILTRDSDVFIPLADRVKIARKGGVDLFLSLHADSAGADATPRGASVYTLSDSGVGRAHYVIGRNEWFTKVASRSGDAGVSQILLDLSQRSTRNHSAMFADLLLQRLGSHGVDLLPRSHRDAGYFVLLAPDVPAALLEMGFVTNPEDEARLAESRARGRMMDAVAEAIDAYFDTSRQPVTSPRV